MKIEAEKQEPVGYLYDWLNPDNRDEIIRDWFAASMYVIEKDKGFNVRPLYTAPVHASEQAEKQEPVAFRNINTGEFCTGGFLRKDWAKWQPLYAAPVHAVDMSQERVDETAKDQHEFEEMVKKGTKAWADTPDDWVDDLRGGVEPVAYASNGHINWIGDVDYKLKADLYTAPPKSEWVGLMLGVRVDEDSVIIKTKNNDAARELCKELLKEKNK